ncbi:MAG: PAS domain-containing protein [Burkholderiaceae bacterium]
MAVLVLWLAWRLSRGAGGPLAHLAATARAAAEVEAQARADEGLPGEFASVATEFNRLLDKPATARAAQLAARAALPRHAGHGRGCSRWRVDAEGRIRYCNGYFLSRIGWRMDELGGEDFGERCVPPERRADREQWRWRCSTTNCPPTARRAYLALATASVDGCASSTMLRDEHGAIVGREHRRGRD